MTIDDPVAQPFGGRLTHEQDGVTQSPEAALIVALKQVYEASTITEARRIVVRVLGETILSDCLAKVK